MAMTSWKTVFTAVAAAMLFAACAKKEEAPPPAEEAPDVSLEVNTPEVEVTIPADANSADAEQSGGDKVSDPEPPPVSE
jgi:PBP1b-binding outer membrane lipoprotein LpoB